MDGATPVWDIHCNCKHAVGHPMEHIINNHNCFAMSMESLYALDSPGPMFDALHGFSHQHQWM